MKLKTSLFAALLLVLGGLFLWLSPQYSVFGGALRDENRNIVVHNCTVYSDTQATVGHQLSSTLLSASTSRAWVMIQRAENSVGGATNTVSVSIDGGAATLESGLELATSTPLLSFGLAGAPFTGAITGITSTGSTTVRVVECGY